jgi:hypothetical protein
MLGTNTNSVQALENYLQLWSYCNKEMKMCDFSYVKLRYNQILTNGKYGFKP